MANTLDTQMQQHTLQGARIRRLTPTECERLQGFPDGWTEGVSETQRYKALGNAVTVDVVECIARRLLDDQTFLTRKVYKTKEEAGDGNSTL